MEGRGLRIAGRSTACVSSSQRHFSRAPAMPPFAAYDEKNTMKHPRSGSVAHAQTKITVTVAVRRGWHWWQVPILHVWGQVSSCHLCISRRLPYAI